MLEALDQAIASREAAEKAFFSARDHYNAVKGNILNPNLGPDLRKAEIDMRMAYNAMLDARENEEKTCSNAGSEQPSVLCKNTLTRKNPKNTHTQLDERFSLPGREDQASLGRRAT